jgi:hypothetical protein
MWLLTVDNIMALWEFAQHPLYPISPKGHPLSLLFPLYTCTYAHTDTHSCVCLHIYIYIYVRVCMCIYIHTYICIPLKRDRILLYQGEVSSVSTACSLQLGNLQVL